MSINEIVNINIDRQTQAVSRASFGVLGFLGLHKNFTEDAKQYNLLSQVSDDGFLPSSPEYLAASAYFGQSPSPTAMVIGRRASGDDTVLTCDAPLAVGETYVVTITDVDGNSHTATYPSIALDTAVEAATGLSFALNFGSSADVSAVDNLDGTLTISPDVASAAHTVVISTENISKAHTAVGTWEAGILAMEDSALPFYGFASYSSLEADILDIATAIEGRNKIYGYSTSNASDNAASSTGIMKQLQDLSRARTFGIWDEEAGVAAGDATEYPECAWFGEMLTYDPGKATWMFKTLVGVSVDGITPSQSTYIRSYNGNTYENIGSVNITREGQSASGEYIDVMRFVDWLQARLQERIYFQLVNLPKIPYTDAGVTLITGEIIAQLQEGVSIGGLNGDFPFNVVAPRVADIDANSKANRILPPITFSATLAGAVHAVTVNGVVTV